MSHTDSTAGQFIQFYTTASYLCSYLVDQKARSQVALFGNNTVPTSYAQLVQNGFRRSGQFIYRPHCDTCSACVPVRIPVASFTPNRSQRRTASRLAHLTTRMVPISERAEYYHLYLRYQRARHPGGGMDDDDYEQFRNFLLNSAVDTHLVEFRDAGQLVMVSVVDTLVDGWSAVYTFYDPQNKQLSYGVYSVLWQIAACRAAGLDYLYLGYWIQDCRKMSYKAGYQPLEALRAGVWAPFHEPTTDVPKRG